MDGVGDPLDTRASLLTCWTGMTTSESRRLDLYNGLQELLGTDRATYLMAHLMPAEMPDLLTRREFDAAMSEIKGALAGLDQKFDRLEDKLEAVNKRIDRVLLVVVSGMFVLVAAIISSGLLS